MHALILTLVCMFLWGCSSDQGSVRVFVDGYVFEFDKDYVVTGEGFEHMGLDSSEGHIVVRLPMKDLLGDSSFALNETESMGITLWASHMRSSETPDNIADAWQRKGHYKEAIIVEKEGLFLVDSGVHVGVFRVSPILVCGEKCVESWVGACTKWGWEAEREGSNFSDKDGCIGRMKFKALDVQFDFPARHISRIDFIQERIADYLETALVSEPE